MGDSSKTHLAVSGKARDVGFLAGILRTQKIPFRQALTFGRKPVLKIPIAYAAPLHPILEECRAQHPIDFVSAEELTRAQDVFWFMVLVAAGILAIAWGRYIIRKFF
jgi:hypothetical protein